ncbi:MAG: SPOR domain-containing protein [Spirochaetota bacterium]
MRRNTYSLFVMILILAFSTAVGAPAQSSWQGNAVAAGAGEFSEEGLFAASNTFPRNQVIEVTNLETGDTTSVTVSKRVNQPGIFLVLSGKAAEELGMDQGDTSRVEARPARISAGREEPGSERALSEDPDVNPGAGLTDEELYPEPIAEADEEAEPEAEPKAEPEEAPAPEDETAEEAAPEEAAPSAGRTGVATGVGSASQRLVAPRRAPDVGTTEGPSIAAAPVRPGTTAGAPEGNEVEQALRVVQERAPGKDMFPAPRDSGVATFIAPPARRDDELGEDDRLALAPEPPEDTEGRPAAEFLGRITAPEEEVAADLPSAETDEDRDEGPKDDRLPPAISREDELEAEGVEPESGDEEAEPSIPEDAVLTLEPAEEKPPEGPKPAEEDDSPSVAGEAEADPEPEPDAEPEREERSTPEDGLSVVTSLERDRYYLQVAAFSERKGARTAVDELGTRYPTEVLEDGGEERTLYRVLVGPLNEDESGTTLYHVRAMGYEDAFVRSVDG